MVNAGDSVSDQVSGETAGNYAGNDDDDDYESDPEALLLAMRRREASDDEEGVDVNSRRLVDPRVGIASDGESDGQGGAQVYEDEELEEEELEGEFAQVDEGDGVGEVEIPAVLPESGGVENLQQSENVGDDDRGSDRLVVEEEKKENEPFAVPTAGAFYMHDDRFRDSGGARHRRTPGGRKIWESKDDREWVHDRFEEMNLREMPYDEERRASKGRFRGRAKNRTGDRGFVRGNRPRVYDDNGNQNRRSDGVKGRGPRRYEPPARNNSEVQTKQSKQYGKSFDTTASNSSGRAASHTLKVQADPVPPRKVASTLNPVAAPFNPSGSSNQGISLSQQRDPQTGSSNRSTLAPVLLDDNVSALSSNASMRGKNIVEPMVQDRLYMEHSLRPITGKMLTNTSANQSPQSRIQGRGLPSGGPQNFPLTSSLNQVNRGQPSPKISAQQLTQRSGSGTPTSSPPRAPSINSSEVGSVESPSGSSKDKSSLIGKGKVSIQGSGKHSFLYNSAQVIGSNGAMAVTHGDQSFPSTPALLPVMQFGGQHHGGLGVPAVGMAFPGYVAQPQSGFGNSEMTWLPVLAGAAGALGATYCSPYIAVDGGYYARPSGQMSSSGVSSKDASSNKPAGVWKPPQTQRPEMVNDEFGQRQNKPRRYSEMNFGQ